MIDTNIITTETALIVVDMQNDFLPGGSLPVEEGDQMVRVAGGNGDGGLHLSLQEAVTLDEPLPVGFALLRHHRQDVDVLVGLLGASGDRSDRD